MAEKINAGDMLASHHQIRERSPYRHKKDILQHSHRIIIWKSLTGIVTEQNRQKQ